MALAREAIRATLAEEHRVIPADLTARFPMPAGVFVTLREADGTLRGCIGTPSPTQENLVKELVRVAPLSATDDPRFPNVRLDELPRLTLEISILGPLQPTDESGLDPAVWGVVLTDGEGRRGLLLPGIPQIETVSQQIAETRAKAGISPNAEVSLQRFSVTKLSE
ncbi:MAG: AmmeMemoRadiSam system protein A [Myxococcales bacterium]|nr:AmmeMemoRadiSam system protein A [Myxococcales bacterium]